MRTTSTTNQSNRVLRAFTTCIGALLLAVSPHISTAANNLVTGPNAGVSFTTGVYNTAYGINALRFDNTGSYNTAVGPNSLLNNLGGNQNTGIGVNALQANTGGSFNLGLGVNTLYSNTSGAYNTGVGNSALYANLTGAQNTAIGLNAMLGNKGGSFNSALGINSLASNVNGNNNTAIGYRALLGATGTGNIGLGLNAGQSLTTGSNNIYIGNDGLAADSGIIRIGTSGTHTTTYLTGTVYGSGAGLTGIPTSSLTGTITGTQIAGGAVTSTTLASNLFLGGTTSGSFSGNVTGNVSGSAASFTGALAGDVTGTQGATAISAGTVTGKALTGFVSGGGTITIGDTILTAINKLDGNVALKAPSASPTFTGTVTAPAFVGDGSGLTNLPSGAATSPANVIPVRGMAWIQPGRFLMGSRADEPGRSGDEGPQTDVTLSKAFWMGVHEVTQAEYAAVAGSNPSFFQSPADPNRPVETVSWTQAVAYCATLTTNERTAGHLPASGWAYRLPTEAEWDYCCRAGARTTRFGYGDDLSATALGNYAWYSGNSANTTHPVEQRQGNPWGLMDMHGNVWEWCQDWYGTYSGGSVTDPQGPPTGIYRVFRGGSYHLGADLCRSAQRSAYGPDGADLYVGFRVVLAPGQP